MFNIIHFVLVTLAIFLASCDRQRVNGQSESSDLNEETLSQVAVVASITNSRNFNSIAIIFPLDPFRKVFSLHKNLSGASELKLTDDPKSMC